MDVRSVALSAIVVLFLALVCWWFYTPSPLHQFRLEVVNQSAAPVDRVILSGSALSQSAVLAGLAVGERRTLQVSVHDSGTLRFNVVQGMNSADAAIVEDTRLLETFHQQLVVEEGNRFLLRRQPSQ